MSSTVIILPLEKNKDLAALVADKEMGDKLYGCFSLKAKDDQTLTLRVEEVTDKIEDLPKPGEYDEDDDEKDDAEEKSNGSTPGETEEADELASPGGMYP